MFVVGERVAHPRAVADPFAALVDDLAAVRPHQRYEAVVRGPGVTRRSRVEGVGDDVRDSVLHLPGAIEDVADDLRDPVGSETGFVEHVAPDVEPAHVESVGDRPHLALIGDTALHRVGVVLPVFPLRDVSVQRLDVARVRELADAVPADVDDVRHIAATGESEEQLRVVITARDLLQVDLHVEPRVPRFEGGRRLVDILGLEPELVGVRDRDRSRDLRGAARRPAAAGRDDTRGGHRL